MDEDSQPPQQTGQLTDKAEQPETIGPTPQQPISPTIQSDQTKPVFSAQIPPQPPSQNKPFKKPILAFVIIIAIFALSVGGWLLTKKLSNSPTSKTNSPNSEKSTANKASLLDTASWTTFDSKIYGISLKIPSDWTAADLPLENPYPGVVISSPTVTLGQKSEDGKNQGVFSIRIRTSKIEDQNNNFFETNEAGSLGKCREISNATLNNTVYKVAATAFSLVNLPQDPYTSAPYNNSSLFDTLYISSGCIPSQYDDSAGSLKPNFQIDNTNLLLTASADFDTAKVEKRGNFSTAIPFTLDELSSNKSLETFYTILSTIKTN